MSFDGIFIHHLLNEIQSDVIKQRINKVNCIDKSSFVFVLSNKLQLLISLNADSSHLRFTKMEYVPTNKTFPFFNIIKKYIESSFITNISQYENDRIVIFDIDSPDELGFIQKVHLILELFGRNSNMIITDHDNLIIDCYKKSFVLTDNDKRILVPKAKYEFPTSDKINPYQTNKVLEENNYQGVSNLLFTEITFFNNLNIINNKTKPQIIKVNNKFYFYCIDLSHLNGESKYFNNLSEMLEEYYLYNKHQNILNSEQKQIENYVNHELTKTLNKLSKQENEKKEAIENLKLEKIGNLLSANLYKIKKNETSITVNDFYNNNEELTITLNPMFSPTKNLENIFNKYKKAKRTITHLEEQIASTKDEIKYYETLEEQLKLSKATELKEIVEELKLGKQQEKAKKKTKPQITTYHDQNGNIIMVGKNNIQNNYLTHTLANKNDYFFHVKDAPGSHTILRCDVITNDLIYLAAMIAGYYSKNKNSSNVAVDYTLVKNVKKVPGTKGSFVTYTNYKTAFVTPDIEYIKKHAM